MGDIRIHSSGSGEGQMAGCCECGNESSGSVTCGEIHDQLTNCQLLKKVSTPCRSLRYVWCHLCQEYPSDVPWSGNLVCVLDYCTWMTDVNCRTRVQSSWNMTSLPQTQCVKVKVKCTLVQALRLCTGCTVHRESRGIALLFHDHGTGRGWGASVTPRPIFTP